MDLKFIRKVLRTAVVLALSVWIAGTAAQPVLAAEEEEEIHYHWAGTNPITDTATLTKPGIATYTCASCRETVQEETICLLGQKLEDVQGYFFGQYFGASDTPDVDALYSMVLWQSDLGKSKKDVPYADFMKQAKKMFVNVPDMKATEYYDASADTIKYIAGGYGDPDHVEYDSWAAMKNGGYHVYGHWMIYDWDNYVYNVGDAVCLCVNVNSDGTLQVVSYEKYPSHTHTVVTDKQKAATCKATGLTEGSHCSVCQDIIKAQKTIPAVKSSTVALKTTSYTYTGKAVKPTLSITDTKGNTLKSGTDYTLKYAGKCTAVGSYTVTVTFKGKYSGSAKLTYKVIPKASSITKVTAASRGFTVYWEKKTTQTTGYQIRYAVSSKMTNAKTVTISKNTTTSKKVTKLKALKTYYVQVRTYKVSNSKKYYSSWSKVKKVKTKK